MMHILSLNMVSSNINRSKGVLTVSALLLESDPLRALQFKSEGSYAFADEISNIFFITKLQKQGGAAPVCSTDSHCVPFVLSFTVYPSGTSSSVDLILGNP